jgi:GNAT superfamily N-acetyltransferase
MWTCEDCPMSTQEVVIRPAHDLDRDHVWPLVRDFADSYVANEDSFRTGFGELTVRSDTLVLVAELEADIIGYLLASYHGTFFANGSVVWIEEVMVTESARDMGIGRSLMNHAEEWAASIPVTYVSLASRRSGDFYRKLGYVDSATYFKKDLAAIAS